MKYKALKRHGIILAVLVFLAFLVLLYGREYRGLALIECIVMLLVFIIGIAFVVELFQCSILYCGELAQQKGFTESCKWFGILLIVGIVIMMLATPAQNGVEKDSADELVKVKKLHEQGVITEDEFLKKKKELLEKWK